MSEHDEQVALFQWATFEANRVPELDLLYAIPNGGARHIATATKLKAEGVKRGVLDIHLPVPKKPYHGLWIEMKYGWNQPTKEQKWWIKNLVKLGHRVDICYSAEEAIETIKEYLG